MLASRAGGNDRYRGEILQGYREVLSSDFFDIIFVALASVLRKHRAIVGVIGCFSPVARSMAASRVISSIGAVRSFAHTFIFGSQN
jgi:hypothetical protein